MRLRHTAARKLQRKVFCAVHSPRLQRAAKPMIVTGVLGGRRISSGVIAAPGQFNTDGN
ncbi:MAG: hypothetical protein IT167_32480 [Bryobacterales bacterium]|nr:hypothetical protein [Bryobacterales bacterium]